MNREFLFKEVASLADAVLTDPRWDNQRDDLGVAILGMLLYGFALAKGRLVAFLDIDEIDATVVHVIMANVGAAERWTTGLVADASASAFDKEHGPGNFALIGIGHSHFGVSDRDAVVDNVFANLRSFRSASHGNPQDDVSDQPGQIENGNP